MNLPKICRTFATGKSPNPFPSISSIRHLMLGYFSTYPKESTKNTPKCYECIHFQHGFPIYPRGFLEFSYGKCNRIYNRNGMETCFSLPAYMARRHSDLCGVEGKYFICRTNYLTNYYASS